MALPMKLVGTYLHENKCSEMTPLSDMLMRSAIK